MATQVDQCITKPSPCPYLDDRNWQLESRLLLDVSPAELDVYLAHGWRRFGPEYFRPVCVGCLECVSIRLPVAEFSPSANQRKTRARCRHLRIEVDTPRADGKRLALYHTWHRNREQARDWEGTALTMEGYAMQFCFPHPCAREISYYDGSRLVAVGFVDCTAESLSSVYFFFHPEYAKLSLGVVSLMVEVEYAASLGIKHVYLGYRVEGCQSLSYKDRFRPREALVGRPEIGGADPVWSIVSESESV